MEVGRLECLRRDFVSILIIALDVAPAVTVIQDSIFEFSRRNEEKWAGYCICLLN